MRATPTAPRATLPLCFAVAMIEGFDLQAAGVAAPSLAPELGLSAGELGLFFSAATFGLIFGALAGGRFADIRGRTAGLRLSLAAFGVCSILTAMAWNPAGLIAARFLTGLGLGGALPSLLAIVAEAQSPDRRAAAVATLYAGMPAGGAVAALLSLLASGEHWRTLFVVGGVIPLLLVPLVGAIAEPSRAASPPAAKGDTHRLLDRHVIGATLLLWASFLLALLVLYLLLNWLPVLLVSRGFTRHVAAMVQVAFNGAGALAGVVTGQALLRLRPRVVYVGSFALLAAALLLLARVPPVPALAIASGAFVGIGVVAVQASLYALATALYPTAVRGTGVGAAVAAGRVGSVLGPLLGAVLLARGGSPGDVLAALLPMVVASAVAALAVERLQSTRAPAA